MPHHYGIYATFACNSINDRGRIYSHLNGTPWHHPHHGTTARNEEQGFYGICSQPTIFCKGFKDNFGIVKLLGSKKCAQKQSSSMCVTLTSVNIYALNSIWSLLSALKSKSLMWQPSCWNRTPFAGTVRFFVVLIWHCCLQHSKCEGVLGYGTNRLQSPKNKTYFTNGGFLFWHTANQTLL